MGRRADLNEFYRLMRELAEKTGGPIPLRSEECHRYKWPEDGVYFFFESGECCDGPLRAGCRVVRVGTHGIKNKKSKGTLKSRVMNHVNNSRGSSVFRRHVGVALMRRRRLRKVEGWDTGGKVTPEVRELEGKVSGYFRKKISFLAVYVPGAPSSKNNRAVIERESIALLSNYDKSPIEDRWDDKWLGRSSKECEIRESGLWNVEHVNPFDHEYDPKFLKLLKTRIKKTPSLV